VQFIIHSNTDLHGAYFEFSLLEQGHPLSSLPFLSPLPSCPSRRRLHFSLRSSPLEPAIWGSAVNSPSVIGAEPRQKTHFLCIFCSNTHLVAVILPLCYTIHNNTHMWWIKMNIIIKLGQNAESGTNPTTTGTNVQLKYTLGDLHH